MSGASGTTERTLEDLYRRHFPEAARLAFLLTGDRVLAEDLAQEAFVRLTGRFAHLRNREAFGAYLRRTVVNLVKNQFRRRAVERRYLEAERPRTPPADLQPDVATSELVRWALMELPPRQRLALVLRYYEDLSERQIGEAIGCAPGTVKSLLSRGTATLRERMAAESETDGE